MILQSHNSWSYAKPKHWWLRPFAFMARCQRVDIYRQYELGVRSFDLRVKFKKNGTMQVAHGFMVYDVSLSDLQKDLAYLNAMGCTLRILHEARNRGQYTKDNIEHFRRFCELIEATYTNLWCYCGRNLYNWAVDYEFKYTPIEVERYSSVMAPKLIDDWYPLLYAKKNNKKILSESIDGDILSIDFVDIQ